jgi:hypothetical protein
VTIDVLANDKGTDLQLTSVTTPIKGGTAAISDGQIIYTPKAGYSGPDSFTYEVTGADNVKETATVNVSVLPKAVDDALVGPVDTPIKFSDALANDLGSNLTLISVSDPSNGTAEIVDGVIVYTPTPGFVGTDAFTYTLQGPDVNYQAMAAINVTIVGPITAVDDAATTPYQTAVCIPVLGNDTVSSLLNVTATAPKNGSVGALAECGLTYTPAAGFSGTDTFTYTITNALGAAATATVTVKVSAAPVKPIIADTGGSIVGTTSAGNGSLALVAMLLGALGVGVLARRTVAGN